MPNRTGLENPMETYLRSELQRLREEWSGLVDQAPPLPVFQWEALKELLLDHTHTPVHEMVVRGALAAVLKQAPFLTPELLLQNILVVAHSALDQDFAAGLDDAPEAPMT